MEAHNATEMADLTTLFTAIGTLAGGSLAGFRIGKSQQLDEVKGLLQDYRDINEVNKADLVDIRCQLEKSKEAEEKCFQQHRTAMARIDELDRGIRAITQIPPKPNRHGKINE